MVTTDRDARAHITASIEGSGAALASDYDIDAILADLRDHVDGGLNIDDIDPDTFWGIVARHDTTDADA